MKEKTSINSFTKLAAWLQILTIFIWTYKPDKAKKEMTKKGYRMELKLISNVNEWNDISYIYTDCGTIATNIHYTALSPIIVPFIQLEGRNL